MQSRSQTYWRGTQQQLTQFTCCEGQAWTQSLCINLFSITSITNLTWQHYYSTTTVDQMVSLSRLSWSAQLINTGREVSCVRAGGQLLEQVLVVKLVQVWDDDGGMLRLWSPQQQTWPSVCCCSVDCCLLTFSSLINTESEKDILLWRWGQDIKEALVKQRSMSTFCGWKQSLVFFIYYCKSLYYYVSFCCVQWLRSYEKRLERCNDVV